MKASISAVLQTVNSTLKGVRNDVNTLARRTPKEVEFKQAEVGERLEEVHFNYHHDLLNNGWRDKPTAAVTPAAQAA